MRESRARRVLRGLLTLYPASFRDSLGDDLVETVLWRWRDAVAFEDIGDGLFAETIT